MAKFPQLDWVAINGRDTPFTKPQHYKEGSTSETDLTGHDNPLPTTDKSVRAELESIKATQDKILERLDKPLDAQVTGSKLAYDNIQDEYKTIDINLSDKIEALTSSILTGGNLTELQTVGEYKNATSYKFTGARDVPNGALGCFVDLNISKSDGVFSENEGILLRVRRFPLDSSIAKTATYEIKTEYNAGSDSHTIIIYPGAYLQDNFPGDMNKNTTKYLPIPLSGQLQFGVSIKGDFTESTGFDFSIDVEWLYQ